MPIPSDFLSFPLFLTPHFFLSYLYLEPGLFLFSLSFHYQVLFLFLGFSPSHALPTLSLSVFVTCKREQVEWVTFGLFALLK